MGLAHQLTAGFVPGIYMHSMEMKVPSAFSLLTGMANSCGHRLSSILNYRIWVHKVWQSYASQIDIKNCLLIFPATFGLISFKQFYQANGGCVFADHP